MLRENLLALVTFDRAISQVHAPTDTETKNIKGFAFVLFVLPEHAVKAYRELDGTIFQGRVLHLLPAKEKPSQVAHDEDKSKSTSYRDKKKAELKAKAGESYTWNSLFMSVGGVEWCALAAHAMIVSIECIHIYKFTG